MMITVWMAVKRLGIGLRQNVKQKYNLRSIHGKDKFVPGIEGVSGVDAVPPQDS